jgi:hypothetical protein
VGTPGVPLGLGQGHGGDSSDVLDTDEGLGPVRGGHDDLVVHRLEERLAERSYAASAGPFGAASSARDSFDANSAHIGRRDVFGQ